MKRRITTLSPRLRGNALGWVWVFHELLRSGLVRRGREDVRSS